MRDSARNRSIEVPHPGPLSISGAGRPQSSVAGSFCLLIAELKLVSPGPVRGQAAALLPSPVLQEPEQAFARAWARVEPRARRYPAAQLSGFRH